MSSASEPAARYSAFISYSHEDARWVRWLQAALEGYRGPRRLRGKETAFGVLGRRLAPVFRDRGQALGSRSGGAGLCNEGRVREARGEFRSAYGRFCCTAAGLPQPLRAVPTAALAL
jgi:hypothetical protein